MIRGNHDFSFPISKEPTSYDMTQPKQRESFIDANTMSSRVFSTYKSLSKKSPCQESVIKGGVKHSRQLEDYRFKLTRKGDPLFRQKIEEARLKEREESKKKKEREIRSRNSKLYKLIKTKNQMLTVKADIEDLRTKLDNVTRKSL